MLPFLKNKQEASISADETPSEDYGLLDAVCDDILSAIKASDKSLLKSALESLCEYLKEEPQEQLSIEE